MITPKIDENLTNHPQLIWTEKKHSNRDYIRRSQLKKTSLTRKPWSYRL